MDCAISRGRRELMGKKTPPCWHSPRSSRVRMSVASRSLKLFISSEPTMSKFHPIHFDCGNVLDPAGSLLRLNAL